MPALTHKERLQPSLLDRLTDEEPQVHAEPRQKRVLSPAQLRECVRRDLMWLFNCVSLGCVDERLAAHPAAHRSVLGYGLPDLAGHAASSVDVPKMERLLREAIWLFEPRLIKESVRVRLCVDEHAMSHNAMSFSIEAALWSQPIPLQLYLRTEIDLEDGHVEVADDPAGRARG